MNTEDDSVYNPHDRFVRRLIGDIHNVRELILWQFPKDVLAVMKLDSIRSAKGSFINKVLREGHSDLVFEVDLADERQGFVVLLFEHKSSPDPTTAFQVLRYIVAINEERQRSGDSLSCVIPMVLYHGPQRWNVACSVRDLIDVPDSLRGYIPDFTLPLLDLSQCSDQELREESLFLAHMALLKYIQRDELPQRLPEILGLFRKLLPPATALESLETILRYLATATERVSREDLIATVKQVLKGTGDSIMPTIAEQWKQEGIERGIEQGIERGKVVGRIQTLQEVLGRDVSTVESLAGKSVQQLQAFAAELNEDMRGLR